MKKKMVKRKSSKKRLSKDKYFLNLAQVVAERGTCPRLKVGTVLVKEDKIISTGYNGAPRGVEHCIEVGCRLVNGHCSRAVHSEVNSILQAAYHGVQTKGSTLYTNYMPCENCTKEIINAGVERIVYKDLYKNTDQSFAKKLLKQAKVKLVRCKE
jgi:dCMP deaminase